MNRFKNITLFLLLAASSAFYTQHANAQDMPTKYPLLELFTNTPCPICGNQDPGFFGRLESYEDQYHLVSFYPGSPYSSCIFYQANTTENRARRDFYPQIVGSPDVALNGVDFRSPNSVSTSILDDITGNSSWLSVQVSETSGVERDVSITLENHGGGDLDTGILYAVIVEREIDYDAPNGIKLHHNVFRKFLTELEGDTIAMNSDVINLTYQYDVEIEWQLEEAYVVVWLMDPETKEVINSGTKFDPLVSSTSSVVEPLPLKLFPNPASEYLNIQIPERAKEALRVYDSSGRLVHHQDVLNIGQVELALGDLAPGLYIAEIILEDGVARSSFEVIR